MIKTDFGIKSFFNTERTEKAQSSQRFLLYNFTNFLLSTVFSVFTFTKYIPFASEETSRFVVATFVVCCFITPPNYESFTNLRNTNNRTLIGTKLNKWDYWDG